MTDPVINSRLQIKYNYETKNANLKEINYINNSNVILENYLKKLDEADENLNLSDNTNYIRTYLKDNMQDDNRILKVTDNNCQDVIISNRKNLADETNSPYSNNNDEMLDNDANLEKNLEPNDSNDVTQSEYDAFFDKSISATNDWHTVLRKTFDEWFDNEYVDTVEDEDSDDDDHNININKNYTYSRRTNSDIYCNTNDKRHLIKFSKIENFDVMTDIDQLVKNMIYNIQVNDINSDIPLYSVGPVCSPFTSEEYCKDINEWYSDADISIKQRIQHSKIIDKHFPIAAKNIEKEKDEKFDYNNNKEYVEYDCCQNGCMVYVGDEINSLNCTKDALKCTLSRFLSCTVCLNDGIDVLAKSKCFHKRIPRKTIRYRSIKLLVIKLIRYETFREVINHESSGSDDTKYQSYKDGNSYKRNKNEMDKQFENYASKKEKDIRIISICLFLSWFFDGTQLFTSRFVNFAPMYISFLNLPFCLKNLNGAGSFLISLFTSKHGDSIEDFLLNDCFIAELQQLAEGMLVDIGDEKLYYVQCRLIEHIQDLIGFNKTLKVKNMATSHSGCMFCNAGKGVTIYTNKNSHFVKFLNNRHWMSIKDPCRTNGYSQQCCPRGFYSDTMQFNEQFNEKGSGLTSEEYYKNQVILESLSPCESENGDHSLEDIKEYLATTTLDEGGTKRKIKIQDTKPYCWFSSTEDYSHFRKHLIFYPHCCYKTPRGKWKRTTDDDWIDRILNCQENDEEFRGVKGPWPFYQLPYASIETDVSPSDPSHTWKNIFKDCLNMLKSEVDTRSLKVNKKLITELKNAQSGSNNKKIDGDDDKVNKPWSFNHTDMECAELYLACILIPENCSKIKLPRIFTQSGMLKIKEIITMFTALLNLILLASTTITFGYKQYFRMLAELVIRSKNNNIHKNDVDPLFWRSRQWLTLSEGLLPVSEMTITKHFLPDIVNHIHNQGPVSGWHALNGETLVSIAKRNVKRTGGVKYDQAAYAKLFECETFKMDSVYGVELEQMKKESKLNLKYKSLYYCSKKETYIQDFDRNDLSHGASKMGKLNSFEYEHILESVENEIINQCNLDENIVLELVTDSILISMSPTERDNYTVKLERIKQIALLKSSFYRVILFLKRFQVKLNSCESLYSSTIKLIKLLKIDTKMIYEGEYTDRMLLDLYSGENVQIVRYDVITLTEIHKYLIESFKFKTIASIMGMKSKGRGFNYSQKISNLTEFGNSNPTSINYLNNCWFKKTQFNSWCKVQLYNKVLDQSNCYGQMNYFFNINCSRDRFVKSLKFVSVTCRVTEFPDFTKNYAEMSGNDQYGDKLPLPYISLLRRYGNMVEDVTSCNDSLPMFILFNRILKTKVASIGFVQRGVGTYIPIYSSEDKTSEAEKLNLFKYNYTAGKTIKHPRVAEQNNELFPIEMLAFIDLSPENLVLPEQNKIFLDIKWIDNLQIKLSSYNSTIN